MRASFVCWMSRKSVGSVYFCRIAPAAIGGDPFQLKSQLTNSGFVDFARKLQAFKIGYVREGGSDAVFRRVQSFNTGSPLEIELHKAVQCEEPDIWESVLHEYFQEHRIRLEWFAISDKNIDSAIQEIAQHNTHGYLNDKFEELKTKKRQSRSNGQGKETTQYRASLSPQQILHQYQVHVKSGVFPRAYLNERDEDVMMCILKKHPQADKKIGVGVDRIFVAPTSYHDSCCFHVRRIDGSEEDFSYRVCLNLKQRKKTHYTYTRPPTSDNMATKDFD